MKKPKFKAASDMLRKMVDKNRADRISFFDIKTALHERGFGILMVILAIPVSLPIPIPPGSTLLPGIPMLILSVQMLMGLDSPWLPGWIGNRTIKRSTLANIVEVAAPHLKRIERLLKPRFSFASSKTGERIIGLVACILSLLVMNPVPFTHMVPAWGILIMSLGLLSKDGVTIILGIVTGVIGVAISMLVFFAGEKALLEIVHLLGFK